MEDGKEVVCTFLMNVKVPPLTHREVYTTMPGYVEPIGVGPNVKAPPKGKKIKLLSALNQAWGYEDGACNVYVDGKLVSKAHLKGEKEPEEMVEAHRRVHRPDILTLVVVLYKDGTRSYEIYEKDAQDDT